MQAGLAGFEIDLLAGAGDHAFFQIDDAVFAEARDRLAGVRVQIHQAVSGGDEHDAVVALAVGPVGNAAARKLARSDGRAISFAQAVDPDHFAGLCIERDHGTARSRGGVEHALHHQRRSFQLVFGAGAEVIGLEAPGDFELVEVGGVDLIERGILGALQIGRVVGPFAILCGWLVMLAEDRRR